LLGEDAQNVLVFDLAQAFGSCAAARCEKLGRAQKAADVVGAKKVGHVVALAAM